MKTEYSSIAAYEPEDFLEVRSRLLSEPSLRQFLEIQLQSDPTPMLNEMGQAQSLSEMDRTLTFPALHRCVELTATSLTLLGGDNISFGSTIITNHRDIILDAAFLSVLLSEQKNIRPYMGIGTNLYVQPWVEDYMRLNRTFSVIRGGSPKELLQHSILLSKYINYLLKQQQCIWLAQREGRAKDSDDRTQSAILKMLTLAAEGDVIERLRSLNITPISLSYEYDPCDYLKAQEMQLKRDNPQYKKTPQDDYINMLTGIKGFKGQIVFTITPSINKELNEIANTTNVRNEQYELAAKLIDRHIHSAYQIFPTNCSALSLLENGKPLTLQDDQFLTYVNSRIDKINIPNKDYSFLLNRILTMYANPLINFNKQH